MDEASNSHARSDRRCRLHFLPLFLLFGDRELRACAIQRLPKVGYLGFGAPSSANSFPNRSEVLRYSDGKE